MAAHRVFDYFELVYRIATVVPPDDVHQVLKGVLQVLNENEGGQLRYGNYYCVAWRSSAGEEQFRPLAGSNASVGELGQLAKPASVQLVFSIPRDERLFKAVLESGLIPHHPWEGPVILIDESFATRTHNKDAPAEHPPGFGGYFRDLQ